jgi:hypothetical protein
MFSWIWKNTPEPVTAKPLKFNATLSPEVSEDRKTYTFVVDFRKLDRCNGVPYLFLTDMKVVMDALDRYSISSIQQDNKRLLNRVFIENPTKYDEKCAITIPKHSKYGWYWESMADCCSNAYTIKVVYNAIPRKIPELYMNYIQLTANDKVVFRDQLYLHLSRFAYTYSFRDMCQSKPCSYNITLNDVQSSFTTNTVCVLIPKVSKCILTSIRYSIDDFKVSIDHPVTALTDLYSECSYVKNYHIFCIKLPEFVRLDMPGTKVSVEVDTAHDNACVPVLMLIGYD